MVKKLLSVSRPWSSIRSRLMRYKRPRDVPAADPGWREPLQAPFFPLKQNCYDASFPPLDCALRLAAEKWSEGVPSFLDRDALVGCWAQVFTGSPGRMYRQTVFRSLASQVLDNLPPEARKSAWACRSLGRLAEICFDPQIPLTDRPTALAGLYSFLTPHACHWRQKAVPRWQTLYERRLKPLIRQRFEGKSGHLADKALRELVVLQAIGAPSHLDTPLTKGGKERQLAAMLFRLQRACSERGLVSWRSDRGIHFVVEEGPHRLADWILLNALSTLENRDWNKVISDATWSALFPRHLEQSAESRELATAFGSRLQAVSEAMFPGRQALVLSQDETGTTVLVLESPLSWQRGRRVQEAVYAANKAMGRMRWLVWEPATVDEKETHTIATCAALAKTLRTFPDQGSLATEPFTALERCYLDICPSTLRAILGAYLRGRITSQEQIWHDFEKADSLLHIVRQVVSSLTSAASTPR